MSTRSSVLVSLLAWLVFLGFGSMNTQFHSSPAPTPPASPPQIAMPAATTAVSDIHLDPLAILDGARAIVDRADWLAVDLRQRKKGDWSSKGTLQRGPNGCCRLELSMRLGSSSQGKMTVVSDGRILARVMQLGDSKPRIETFPMPEDRASQAWLFTNHGCGGPSVVLAQARAGGSDWTAQLATVGDRPGVALTGRVAPTPNDVRPQSPKVVRLFLDAETLWLARAEWWSDTPEQNGTVLYETEFLQPRVNQPLSQEECERAFSYRVES